MSRPSKDDPDPGVQDQPQPVSRGYGASWLAACMAHDMLYGGDVIRTVALLRRRSEPGDDGFED